MRREVGSQGRPRGVSEVRVRTACHASRRAPSALGSRQDGRLAVLGWSALHSWEDGPAGVADA